MSPAVLFELPSTDFSFALPESHRLEAADDEIRCSPSCMSWCHCSGAGIIPVTWQPAKGPPASPQSTCTLRTAQNECASPSSACQKANIPKGHPVAFHFIILFSLSRLFFFFLSILPSLNAFLTSKVPVSLSPRLPLLSSCCPAPVPGLLLLTCSQSPADPSIPLLQTWSWRKWQAQWTAGVCLTWQLSPVPTISIAAVVVQPDIKYSPSLSLKYALYKFQALGERKVDWIWCHLFFMNIHNLYIIFISKLSSSLPSRSSSSWAQSELHICNF